MPLVSPNTVKRLLRDAGLWPAPAVPVKGGPSGENRTADEPGQTLNVDLCFVPAVHEAALRLPAVSGSSGRLVIYGPREGAADAERTWPGQVFADPETTYAQAMREFVWRSAPQRHSAKRHAPLGTHASQPWSSQRGSSSQPESSGRWRPAPAGQPHSLHDSSALPWHGEETAAGGCR